MYVLRVAFIVLLTQSVNTANILGVFMFPSISHQVVYQPIWRELSLRGHKVTVVTPNPLNDPSLTNLTEISVEFTYNILKQTKIQELLSKDLNVFQMLEPMFKFMNEIAEAELNSTQVKELIADENQQFDLILLECFHPVMYGLAGRFKAPTIGVSSLGAFASIYDSVGNPTHPVLYPEMMLNYHNRDLSLWQKIKSVMFSLWTRYYFHIKSPAIDQMAKRHFGEDIPHIEELQRNQSMLFLNVNPLIYLPRPNVPAIVELGHMHIKKVKPLPQELKIILDNAKQGVIYFSLGSNVKSIHLQESLRKNIIEALSELPYLVLWKWESDHLPDKPKNVITKKWLPQQDILAHPNIRAFVTQGGLQSTEEAISRKVPLVGMPFIGDQPMNVQRIVDIGIGLSVDPATVTKDELKNSILEVAGNPKYKKKMKEVRELLFDKPMTGLEKAVWWSEYVIRHKGARHLRSPTADVSWFDYFMVDVIIALACFALAFLCLIYYVVKISMNYKKNKQKIQ